MVGAGGSQGIGLHIAKLLAREGCAISIVDIRDTDGAVLEIQGVPGSGKVQGLKGDVTSFEEVTYACQNKSPGEAHAVLIAKRTADEPAHALSRATNSHENRGGSQISNATRLAEKEFGPVAILVANAGILLPTGEVSCFQIPVDIKAERPGYFSYEYPLFP